MGLASWHRNLSIGKKLFVGYAAVFAVSLLLGGLIVSSLVSNMVREASMRQLGLATRNMKTLVLATVQSSIRNHLRAVAEKNMEIVADLNHQARNGSISLEEAKRRARKILLSQTIGQTGYIYALNSNGSVAVHPQLETGASVAGFDFARKQMAEKHGYVEYDWKNPGDPAARPKAMYMAYFEPWDWIISASSYRDEFLGLINLDAIREAFKGLRFGDSGYPYVLDSKGNVIFHPALTGNVLDAQDTDGRYFVREMLEKQEGVSVYNWRNPGESEPRHKTAVYSSIPELGWLLASSGYDQESQKQLVSLNTALGLTLLIALGLAIPLTLWLTSLFTAPIRQLVGCFGAASDGNLSVRLPDPGGTKDDFGMLAGYFNGFMGSLEKASHELQESERRFRSIVNNAVEGIYQSLPEGRFIMVNKAMSSMLRYDSPEDMVASITDIATKFYTEDTDRLGMLALLDVDDKLTDYETRVRRKDGTTIWCRESCRVVRDENRAILYYEGTLVDISQRKRAETLEREMLHAVAANQAKSQFLANVSHELRTPMNSVLGMVDLLRETDLAPDQAELVAILENSGNDLLSLINELLDIARIEAGKLRMAAERFDPRAACMAVVVENMAMARRKGLSVDLALSPDLPEAAVGDEQRLKQVLHNLVGNAIKFTKVGGVTVHAGPNPDAEDELLFRVEDTGVGIPPGKEREVFKRFTQADSSTTRVHGGAGLGLAICRSLVGLMGGTIRALPGEGKGATFVFTIKRDLAHMARNNDATPPQANGKG